MTAANNKLWVALDTVYKGLCKWDVRVASYDNPVAAMVFLFFLKFISDNKRMLGLKYSEIYDFDYMALLYGEKIKHEDIVAHVAKVEKQLGCTNGILASFANQLELLKLDKKLKPLLQVIKEIDLAVESERDFSIYDALVGFLMLQAKKEIRFPTEALTEINLSKLMSSITQLDNGMTVYDFAAGYSILLSEVAKGKSADIYAQDINTVSAAVSIMLLVLSMNRKINVFCDDTLVHPCTIYGNTPKQFDRVISTPPLGMKLPKKEYLPELDMAFEFGLGNTSSKTDLVFAQHLLASLKTTGKGVMLLASGALFRGGRDTDLRKAMLKHNYIDVVIDLPPGIIPATLVKASIVVFDKSRTTSEIFFMDLSKDAAKDYFERSGRAGVRITDKGVEIISEIVNNKREIEGLSKLVTVSEVLDNGVNLCASAYIGILQNDKIEIQDINELKQKSLVLYNRLAHLNKRFNEIIDNI